MSVDTENKVIEFFKLGCGGIVIFHGSTFSGKTYKARELFPYVDFLFDESDASKVERDHKALLKIPQDNKKILIVDETYYVSPKSIRELIHKANAFRYKLLFIVQDLFGFYEEYGHKLKLCRSMTVKFSILNNVRAVCVDGANN